MFFARSDWLPIQEYPRIFLAHITAHEIDNMASWFPESLGEAIPINTKKTTKFGLDVFQDKGFILKHSTSQFHKRSRNCTANTKQLSTSEFV